MQIVLSAVGPDNRGLADPIVHHVTGRGANIAEIQMYDHDEECLFAMLLRIELDAAELPELKSALAEIGRLKQLSIRVWSPEERASRPRLAICTTLRQEPALALLRAIRDKTVPAEAAVMIGTRNHCRALAEQFGIDWHLIGDEDGAVDERRLVELCDQYEVDYIILARYMRILSPSTCWKFAGGRIVNLHHGLLPSFPARGHITTPSRPGCSHTGPPAISSCRSWTRATRSFTNRRLRFRRGRNSMRCLSAANKTTSRSASWKESAES